MTSLVLVTGGTGRLGRHVVQRLHDAQFEVRVLTRRSRKPADGIEFVVGDLATGHGRQQGAAIAGVIVLRITEEWFLIDNVAVHPAHRGRGLGRALLDLAEAEARRAGFGSVYLYTHEKMTENLALYSKIGYAEYDPRPQEGLSLVYLRKCFKVSFPWEYTHEHVQELGT